MANKNNYAFLDRIFPIILIVGGSIGLLASFVLTLEKIQLLIKPTYVASCNLSPILSCTNIMKSSQAGLFGFPNPLIGIASFAVVITIGVGMLAGARYKRWFMLGLESVSYTHLDVYKRQRSYSASFLAHYSASS